MENTDAFKTRNVNVTIIHFMFILKYILCSLSYLTDM